MSENKNVVVMAPFTFDGAVAAWAAAKAVDGNIVFPDLSDGGWRTAARAVIASGSVPVVLGKGVADASFLGERGVSVDYSPELVSSAGGGEHAIIAQARSLCEATSAVFPNVPESVARVLAAAVVRNEWVSGRRLPKGGLLRGLLLSAAFDVFGAGICRMLDSCAAELVSVPEDASADGACCVSGRFRECKGFGVAAARLEEQSSEAGRAIAGAKTFDNGDVRISGMRAPFDSATTGMFMALLLSDGPSFAYGSSGRGGRVVHVAMRGVNDADFERNGFVPLVGGEEFSLVRTVMSGGGTGATLASIAGRLLAAGEEAAERTKAVSSAARSVSGCGF